METPAPPPSAPDAAAPYLTGRIVPRALAESGEPGESGPGTATADDAPRQPARRILRFLVEPKWIAWHLFVAAAFCGMLWLGDWQFRRAMGGNGLSWAYTFEWPLFAAFGVVFWARTVRDEYRLRRDGGVTEAQLVAAALAADALLPDGVGARQRRWDIGAPDGEDPDDAELASYNAYLAQLSAKERRKALGAG